MNGLERLRALGARLEGLAVERATVAVDGKPLWRVLLDIAGQIECEQVEGGAWVREHGGLEPIKSSLSALELLAEGIEIDTGLAFYDESPKERCVALRNEVKSRLMPEGMEWPCFDDGEPVRIGDEAPFGSDGRMVVTGIELVEGGFVLHGRDGGIERPCQTGYKVGVRVKRPAPKVLDADGVEILEKRDAWWICEGDERGVHAERLRVETICPNGLIECSPYNGGTWVYLEPSELYDHRAKLFSVIVRCFKDRAWKSKLHHDGTMYEGMFIVGIETSQGQATYHYDIDPYWNVFDCKELARAPEWDGHTPEQAISRIASLRPSCDRDALLALADDVDGAADDSGGFEPLAGMLRDIARCIREACGEAEHGR